MNNSFRTMRAGRQPGVNAPPRVSLRPLHPKSFALAVASAFALPLLASPAFGQAMPSNPTVVNGAASFQQNGKNLTVTNTPGAIINWQSFSIGSGASAQFIQQNSASAVFNRVTGSDPSMILGNLSSNGQVFLINPNGITIGAGARIDAAAFVASTLGISNSDLLAGRFKFEGGPGTGNVVNHGTIVTQSGGFVYFIGKDVQNSGVVHTPGGQILLAAGKTVEIINPKSPDVRVEINADGNEAVNLGKLVASGGTIGMYAGNVRQKGVISATTAEVNAQGKIVLVAKKDVEVAAGSRTEANGPNGGSITIQAQGGVATVQGTVEAKGISNAVPEAGMPTYNAGGLASSYDINVTASNLGNGQQAGAPQPVFVTAQAAAVAQAPAPSAPVVTETAPTLKGGDIKILGEAINLTGNATIDASGEKGGGTILIGGDYQGSNASVQNSLRTFVGEGVTLRADALVQGNGGKAIVWAEEATYFVGSLSAQGGLNGGDGGLGEVSGKKYLYFRPTYVSLAARRAGYRAGTLLLDPSDVTLTRINTTGFQTTGGTFSSGTFSPVNNSVSTIDIEQIEDILDTTNVIITSSGGTGTGSGSITLAANQSINNNSSSARTLTLQAYSDIVLESGSSINGSASALSVNLRAGTSGSGTITTQAGSSINSSGGSVNMTAVGTVNLSGSINTAGGSVMLISTGADITQAGSVTTAGGSVTLNARTNISLGDNISAGSGSMSLISSQGSITQTAGALSTSGNVLAQGSGSGSVSLTQSNALSGGINLTGGSASLTNNGAVKLTGSNVTGALTINASGDITQTGALTAGSASLNASGHNITLTTVTNNIGTLSISNAADVSYVASNNVTVDTLGASGDISLKANVLTLSANTVVASGKMLTLNVSGASSITGNLSGAGGLNKSGSGMLTLSGTNTYGGATNVAAGTLKAGSAGAFNSAGALNISGAATLDLDVYNATFGSLSGATAGEVKLGTGTLTVGGNNASTTFSGLLSGGTGGSLTKVGTGTLTLAHANTYTGATNVSGGTLQAGNAAAFGTGEVNVSSGATLNLSGINLTIGSLAGAGTVTLGSNTLTTGGNNLDTTFSGTMGGAGGLAKTGSGVFTLSGAGINYSGVTQLNSGTLAAGSSGAFSVNSALVMATGTTLNLAGFDQEVGSLAGAGGIALSGGNLTAGRNGLNTTFTGNFSATAGALIKTGAGAMTLAPASGSNQQTGGTVINQGSINVTDDLALGDIGTALVLNGGTLGVSGLVGAINRSISLSASGGTIDTGTGSATVSSKISGTGGLAKAGSGMLSLTSSTSDYSGGTTIGAGTLAILNNTSLGATSGGLTLAAGTTLRNLGAMDLDRAVTLSGGTATFDNQGFNLNVSGKVTGSGGLNAMGSGVMALLNTTNDYQGGTTLTGGTLEIKGDGSLGNGAGALTLNGGTVLRATGATDIGATRAITLNAGDVSIDAASAVTIRSQIGGAGKLVKLGSADLVLAGTGNTYQGGTLVNAGSLGIRGDGSLGNASGGLTLAGGTTLYADGVDVTVGAGRLVTLSGNANIDSRGQVLTINGQVTGNARLTKVGAGTLVLGSTANDYGLGTTISAGTLSVSDNANLGLATAALNIENGGTLLATSSFTSNRTINLTGGATISAATGINTSLTGVIGGAGASLTKTGLGTLTLSGSNTYDAGTTVAAGTLAAASNTALGANTVNVSAGAVLDMSGSGVSINNSLNLSGTLGASGNGNILTGGITLAAGSAIDVGSGNTLNVSGVIGGASLNKTGAGTLALFASNGYSGTNINGGVLEIRDDNNLGAAGGISFNGGTLRVAAAVTSSRQITLAGNGTIETAVDSTFSGNITGTGGLVKSGSAVLTLGSGNSFGGGTSIAAGTVKSANASAFGTGGITVEAGTTLELAGDSQDYLNSLILRGTLAASGDNNNWKGGVNLSAGSSINVSASKTLFISTSAITGAALNKNGGGTLELSTANSYSNTNLSGGTLRITNSSALGTGPVVASSGTTLELSAAGGLTVGNNISLSGANLLASGTGHTLNGTLSVDGTVNINVAGTQLNIGGKITGAGGLTKTGNLLVLSGTSDYTGGTTISAGTVRVTNSSALGSGVVNASSGTTLELSGASGLTVGNNISLSDATLLASGAGHVINGTLTLTGGTTVNVAGTQLDITGKVTGAGSLTKTGNLLVLGGTSDYSGGTTISAGTLRVTNSSGLGSGAVNASSGTTLELSGAGGLTVGNTINLSDATLLASGAGHIINGTLTLNGGTTVNVAGTQLDITGKVTGTGSLTKTGNLLVLGGSNDYSGGTTISTGALRVTNSSGLGGGAVDAALNTTLDLSSAGGLTIANGINLTGATLLASSGNHTLNGSLNLIGSATVNVTGGTQLVAAGSVAGAGSLNKTGSGTLALNVSNSYGGGTTVSQGTLGIANNSALGTGAATVNTSATLSLAGGLTVGNTLNLSGTLSSASGNNNWTGTVNLSGTSAAVAVATGSDTLTISGAVAGGGSLAKSGPGTLELTHDNTYSGGTTITGGLLRAMAGSALGGGAVNASAGTVLELSHGTGLSIGNAINLSGATLRSSSGSNTLTGAIGLSGGNTFDVANSLTVSGNVTGGSGDLNKTGAGTLVLAGSGSYRNTVVNQGILSIASDGNLGAGSLTLGGATLKTTNTVTSTRNVILTGAAIIDAGGATSFGGPGVVSGGGSLNKTGAATLTLSGSNTYSGGTTVSSGTLVAGNSSALGGGSVNVTSGATLNLSGGVLLANGLTLDGGTLSSTGTNANTWGGTITLTGTGAVIDVAASNTLNVTGAVGGSAPLTKSSGGTLVLTNNANNYSGGTTVTGGTVRVTSGNALGTNDVNVSAGSVLEISGASGLTVGNNINLSDATLVSNGGVNHSLTGTLGLSGTNIINVTGTRLTAAGNVAGTGTLNKTGAGTLGLTHANNGYSGAVNVSAGVLSLEASNAIASASSVTLTNVSGVAMNLVGADQSINTLSGGGAAGGNIDLGGNQLTVNQATDGTFSGKINGSGGRLVKDGAAMLTLGGVSTYSGSTRVSNGTLQLGVADAIAASSGVTLDDVSGAVLGLSANQRIASLAGGGTTGGNVNLSAFTLNVSGTVDTTYAGKITGTGGIAKGGGSVLTLTNAASDFGGSVAVNGGKLVTNNLGAAGGSNTVAAGATLEIATAGGAVVLINETIGMTSAAGNAATLRVSGALGATLSGAINLSGGSAQAGVIDVANSSFDASAAPINSAGGGEKLTVSGAGGTFTAGNIGATNALGGLTLSAANVNVSGGTIRSTGRTTVSSAVSKVAGSGALVLAADELDLTGTLNMSGQALTLTTAGHSNVISINSAAGNDTGRLTLSSAELANITGVSALTFGDSAQTSAIQVVGTGVNLSSTGATQVKLVNSGSNINFAGNLTSTGALDVSALGGSVSASGGVLFGATSMNFVAGSGIGSGGAPIKIGNTGPTGIKASNAGPNGGIYIQTMGTLDVAVGGFYNAGNEAVNLSTTVGGVNLQSGGINSGAGGIVITSAGKVDQSATGSSGLITSGGGGLTVRTYEDSGIADISLVNDTSSGNQISGAVVLETRKASAPSAFSAANIIYKSFGGTDLSGFGTTGDVFLTATSFVFSNNQPLVGRNVVVTSTTGDITLAADLPYTIINAGAPGGSLTLRSAANININAQIGAAPDQVITIGASSYNQAYNHALVLEAAHDINVTKSMYLTTDLNFTAGGSVNIQNQAGATTPLVIKAANINFGSALQRVASVNIGSLGNANVAGQDRSVLLQSAGVLGIYTLGDFTLTGGTASATGALAAAAIGGADMVVDVKGNFVMRGGTASGGGAASALVQATSSKTVLVGKSLVIQGGTVTGSGNAEATFDPAGPLNIIAGDNVVLQAGTGPSAGATLANQGAINISVNTSGGADYVYAGSPYRGLIVIGASGSGLFNNDPLLGLSTYNLGDPGSPPPITLTGGLFVRVVDPLLSSNSIVLANVQLPGNPDLAQQIRSTNIGTQITNLDSNKEKKLQDDGCNN